MEDSDRQELLQTLAGRLNQAVQMYVDNCSRCGVCIEACHAYASTGDVRYSAVARAQNIRRLVDNYHRITGKVAPWFNEAVELDDMWMQKVYETAFTCTGCRRCMVYCPFGIDTQQIQMIAKAMLIVAGEEPKPLTMRAKASIAKGEDLAKTKEKFLKEVEKAKAEAVKLWPSLGEKENPIPIDVEGADVLFVSFGEAPSIVPPVGLFNAAGESWTLSYFEAVNFGAFLGSPEMSRKIYERIVDEAARLKIKTLVLTECGTAYRIMKHMTGKHSFDVVNYMEIMDRYRTQGRIKFDKSRVEGKITYHDPCQIARNAGVYEAPRKVLRALTDDYVELSPNRKENWCCGGGGGLVLAAEPEFRVQTSKVKADQLKASGAEVVATACEMCLAQLKDVNDEYELDMRVTLVSELVAEALDFE